MGLKRVLDFDGIDVEAAGDDHVFGAIDNVEEMIRVEVPDIPGVMPAVQRGLGGCFRIFVVPIHDKRATNHDFAALS